MPYKQLRDEVGRIELALAVRNERARELVIDRMAFLRRQEAWKLIAAGLGVGVLAGRMDPARPMSRLLSLALGVWRLMTLASHWLVSPLANEAGNGRD